MTDTTIVNSHIDLCEAILEDFLQHVQRPSLLCDENGLEGLLLAADSWVAYCVQIEGIISSGNNSLLLQLMNGVISSANSKPSNPFSRHTCFYDATYFLITLINRDPTEHAKRVC